MPEDFFIVTVINKVTKKAHVFTSKLASEVNAHLKTINDKDVLWFINHTKDIDRNTWL